jgi:prophage DNA circulation protein
MIFTNSRYATGTINKVFDSRNNKYQVSVSRVFPTKTKEISYYYWAEKDRMDIIATRFLGNPDRWWEIMDLNPEIVDPLNIPLGTKIRVPYAK